MDLPALFKTEGEGLAQARWLFEDQEQDPAAKYCWM